MNSLDILFTTSRFNATEVKEHFINDCCFGEDLAKWLKVRLVARGLECDDPGQEDWGWYLPVSNGVIKYTLNCSAMTDPDAGPQTSNDAEWRIVVVRHRTLKEKLKGEGRIQLNDPVLSWVFELCQSEPDFADARVETL